MLKNQIKSVLRNSTNRIYIITFVVVFVILNISINLKSIIDGYYDLKMEMYLSNYIEKYNKLEEYLEIEKDTRTIYINTVIKLTEEDKKEILKLKYVRDVKIEEIETNTADKITLNYIIVDNWKNCKLVQNYFDRKGIETSILWSQNELYESYNAVKVFSDVIKYVFITMSILVLIVCYKNVLKNEQENMKLLKIIGYNKNKMRIIMLASIIALTVIGFTIGFGIFKILLYLYNNILNISIAENIAIDLVINIAAITFSSCVAIVGKVKKI